MQHASALDALLSAYWLRPETALWRACDIHALQGFRIEAPALDLGCGDGVFSFIRAGGTFDEDFDVFQSIERLDEYFEKADVYDAHTSAYRAAVRGAPAYRFAVGLDHKQNLLKRAGATALYERLVHHDANRELPFAPASFQSVFSNIVYWLDDPAHCLREIRRVLAPGGTAAVLLPNRDLRVFSFYQSHFLETGDARFKFLELLDRGRFSDNIKHARSLGDWQSMIEAAGLRVEGHVGYLCRLVVQIWDVGLRPIFPPLVSMANSLAPAKRNEIKLEWVRTLRSFAAPLLDLDRGLCAREFGFHCFVLR